jgi:hypothetical protein
MSLATFLFLIKSVYAQTGVIEISPSDNLGDGLDLHAVSTLFQESEDLEAFEKALNAENDINNLDLNDDGQVDYIRVLEEITDETHIVVLQAVLGENDFQDVATIEIEKNDDDFNLQVHGNEDLYGPDYYIVPVGGTIHTWPIIVRIYGPNYRPYRSRYYWNVYPRWWRPYRPVKVHIYRRRTIHHRNSKVFVVTKKGRVRSVSRVRYKPVRSNRVVKRTGVKRTPKRPVRKHR